MGLCKTSNFSIFTFINASDLKFCTRSYSSCAYRMMRFKGSNEQMCKMTLELYSWDDHNNPSFSGPNMSSPHSPHHSSPLPSNILASVTTALLMFS